VTDRQELGSAFRRGSRWLGWSCVLIIVVLSWLPASELVRTGVNPRVEHGFAYTWAGIFLSFGYSGRRPIFQLLLGLAALACAMELGQFVVEGRHPAVLDALASASGGVLGSLIGVCMVVAESQFQGKARPNPAESHDFSES